MINSFIENHSPHMVQKRGVVIVKLLRQAFVFILISVLAGAVFFSLLRPTGLAVFSPEEVTAQVLIIDAGHGGLDGGAVSSDGIIEAEINLEITKRLALLMLFCGQRVALTRADTQDLASPDALTVKERKVSDLKNRVAAVNSASNAVLISIHQNSIADHPEVHGAQAFYNLVDTGNLLAEHVQQRLNQDHNNGNEKSVRLIDSSIYLMNKINCPAVLVECGFLSNKAEARALCTADCQKGLALAIAAGYLSYISEVSK